MRWARPKSLSGLMLLGLALIAVPLLIAVLNAAVQMREIAATSEKLVVEGVRATRASQELFAEIAAVERSTRIYQVLRDPTVTESIARGAERLTETRAELGRHLRSPGAISALSDLGAAQDRLLTGLASPSPTDADFAALLGLLDAMQDAAGRIAENGNAQIDADLAQLREQTRRAQRRLYVQSSLLVPLSLIAILALTLSIGRPLRQIDRAISELGRGAFTHPIAVSGPRDLERLGHQLEWLRQRLLDLAQERNRFLRHMSHELKTPLANIREGTELLMDGAVGELGSGQREVTAILRDNGIKLQRLIENLLSFSAWQSQSATLEISEFRLRPLVKQVLENQQLTLLSQRVRLDVRIDDLVLLADRSKLRLILENLLSNAIKYSPKGGAIHLHARAHDDNWQLDVADSGAGVPPEERARIFDAFYTGKVAPGGHVKGTGIGLSVVLEFINAHGGTIEIVDGEYSGAHFCVRLPQRAASAEPMEQAHAA
ncbi:MAG: HAMP domain-containing histidine kinase [Steroidobacteraceae bacterium]|nr:HAMP domain-containing histidine kinase [Steroidobacteraceae bacterium]